MRRVLLVSAIAVLVFVAIGGVVFSVLQNKAREMKQVMEAAAIDLAAAMAGSLQRVEVMPQIELDGLTTKVRLRIENSGKASCEYRLVEYKLAGHAPREATFPLELARLDPGQVQEFQLTFDNVPWEWTDQEAKVFEIQKSWSQTLPPKDAPPGQKLAISSSGESYGSNPAKLDAEEFKKALPTLKERYPKVRQSLSCGATGTLAGDITTVIITCLNNGDLPLLDFTLRNARLGGEAGLAGEFDPTAPKSPSEIKPGESRTFKVHFQNVPWDFSKSDSPFLNLVIEYAFRRRTRSRSRDRRFNSIRPTIRATARPSRASR